ncbi:expressed unknown protein [Ectocarpus siliculosus]|uniref:PPPDE domain-containing protein n=1 Tax=Ectocarpus siliculosus TaxID=2880 RepID=D8LFH5_ECTSI|nr:expressed unknown protein [Ectocarpus siliculosus]|eukprot:CBN79895.1 expressed unknown protein [Ectocarpus siliculosus]
MKAAHSFGTDLLVLLLALFSSAEGWGAIKVHHPYRNRGDPAALRGKHPVSSITAFGTAAGTKKQKLSRNAMLLNSSSSSSSSSQGEKESDLRRQGRVRQRGERAEEQQYDVLARYPDTSEKKAWVLAIPLEDGVVREVAEELGALNAARSKEQQYAGEIRTHFAVLLQVGDGRCLLLERRGEGGVTASDVRPSEVKHRAVRSEARVASSLEEIASGFFRRESGRQFDLATNNCRNFAHNFYREFCEDTPFSGAGGGGGGGGDGDGDQNKSDVESFCRWVEQMDRKDGL